MSIDPKVWLDNSYCSSRYTCLGLQRNDRVSRDAAVFCPAL